MSEGVFTYRAENGNVCEIVDTFAEMLHLNEIWGCLGQNPFFCFLIGEFFLHSVLLLPKIIALDFSS